MRTLLVGYDLNSPGQDYSDLVASLKSNPQWWHYLDSTWLIRTTQTPVQVRDDLRKLIDKNDELLVMDVTGRSAAWSGFREKAGQWIMTHV